MTQDLLTELANIVGVSESDLETGFQNVGPGPSFPSDNIVGQRLVDTDIFGSHVARVILKTYPEPLPQPDPTYQSEAVYWWTHWHGAQGDQGALTAQFVADCKLAEPYLPALKKRTRKKKGTWSKKGPKKRKAKYLSK